MISRELAVLSSFFFDVSGVFSTAAAAVFQSFNAIRALCSLLNFSCSLSLPAAASNHRRLSSLAAAQREKRAN